MPASDSCSAGTLAGHITDTFSRAGEPFMVSCSRMVRLDQLSAHKRRVQVAFTIGNAVRRLGLKHGNAMPSMSGSRCMAVIANTMEPSIDIVMLLPQPTGAGPSRRTCGGVAGSTIAAKRAPSCVRHVRVNDSEASGHSTVALVGVTSDGWVTVVQRTPDASA